MLGSMVVGMMTGSVARELVSRLTFGKTMMAAERTAKTTRIGIAAMSVCSVDRLVINLNMTEINWIVNFCHSVLDAESIYMDSRLRGNDVRGLNF
ncbi:hypothetical protein KKA49_01255 [Patescibacteria group bacterium]|nr:hypothetical protein [Patescibacteria group bacterium]